MNSTLDTRPPLTRLSRLCLILGVASLLTMAVTTTVEVTLRALAGLSIQVSNEIGGYLLVSLTFFSLAVCQERDAFIQFNGIQGRLPPRLRAASQALFGVLALAFCAILEFYLIRLVLRSYESGSVSATLLFTPQWIPQSSMPLGLAAFIVASLRTFARDVRLALGR